MELLSLLISLTLIAKVCTTPAEIDTAECGSGPITSECCSDCFGTLPSVYSLTTVKFDEKGVGDPLYNGLKVQSFDVFQEQVASYCPLTGDQASLCPNGTDMALAGTLLPLSLIPGGQEMYVNANGLISITVQHSHFFPAGSYPYYYGWAWTPYQIYPATSNSLVKCNGTDLKYNCDPPTGFWNFQAPNATVGGLRVCPNEFDPSATSVYAVTPEFNRTDCVELHGLGTHEYTGPNPPVWAYF